MGRLVKDPEIKEVKDQHQVLHLRLAVRRSFKNANGTYDTDFYNITFWDFLVDYVKENLKKGVAVVVKGRLQSVTNQLANGYHVDSCNLIGEKVMFFENYHENES